VKDEAYEPASVEAERIAWLRAVHWTIRRRVESSPAVAAWRRWVPRPLDIEALLMVAEPLKGGFQVPELAGRLGLGIDRARALCRWARRVGVLTERAEGWVLSRRGRTLLGDLEAAQAEALRSVGRGIDPEAWRSLWTEVDAGPVEPPPKAPLRVQNRASSD